MILSESWLLSAGLAALAVSLIFNLIWYMTDASLLNLAMISCLNRPHELRLHIAGALTNGVTREEIREVFMQVAIYAGVPAGVDSFRAAKEVFAQLDKK